MPTELPCVDCEPLGLNGDQPTSGRSERSVVRERSSNGVDMVGCSAGFSSSFGFSRLRLCGLSSSVAAAGTTLRASSMSSCPSPGRVLCMFCTCRSVAVSATLLKGCTSGRAVKPAGRPNLDPSADDKAAVLELPCNGGNSGAAEAFTPSAAFGSLVI